MKALLVPFLLSLAMFSPAAALPESTKIDELLAKDWEKNGLKPNPPASDEVLVRRLYLDIAGRVPTIEEVRQYLESRDPQKRSKLIDTLLAGDGFTSHMFNYWADVLRLTDNVKGRVTAQAYEEWLKKKVKANTPFDQMVRELITTDGGVWDSGAIGFYLRDENKLDHLAYTVQVFLGTQIVCAQCHNHPFDKWTQKDYYHMAAFTYGMDTKGYNVPGLSKKKDNKADIPKPDLTGKSKEERKVLMKEYQAKVNAARSGAAERTPQISREDAKEVKEAMQDVMKPLRYTNISWNDNRLPTLPHDYQYSDGKPGEAIQPRPMFGHEALPAGDETRLHAFAKWMTSPENPRFTTVVANRMWKRVFGTGLIEPVDEIMDSTVASNPELMDYLTQLMIEKKYSLKSFLRILYNTETYQREATKSEVLAGETYHFTGPQLRRMSAEQVWDSMATLVSGNVDSTVDDENVRLNQYMDDLKFLMTTVRDKGVEGLVEVSKKANEVNDANIAALEQKRKQLVESGDEANVEKAKELAREASSLRRERARDILVSILGEDRANDLRQGYNEKNDKKHPAALSDEMKAKLAELPRAERKEAIKKMANQRGDKGLNLGVRASEQPSPAKPGTFLRTFGQSDREEIENASREASVPQALALLNGPAVQILTSPTSLLQQKLTDAKSSKDKAEVVYQAFLSRQPTADELTIINQVFNERGDKAVEDIIHALLTGSQFLFIQ